MNDKKAVKLDLDTIILNSDNPLKLIKKYYFCNTLEVNKSTNISFAILYRGKSSIFCRHFYEISVPDISRRFAYWPQISVKISSNFTPLHKVSN